MAHRERERVRDESILISISVQQHDKMKWQQQWQRTHTHTHMCNLKPHQQTNKQIYHFLHFDFFCQSVWMSDWCEYFLSFSFCFRRCQFIVVASCFSPHLLRNSSLNSSALTSEYVCLCVRMWFIWSIECRTLALWFCQCPFHVGSKEAGNHIHTYVFTI